MTVHETLIRAASSMREAHGPEHKRHKMWAAIARMLELAAEDAAEFSEAGVREDILLDMFEEYDVAVAYLEADPS